MSRERLLSYHGLQRCRTTIEDFVLTYFPLQGLDPAKDFFQHMDLLLFVEAAIYEMDEENEQLTASQTVNEDHAFTAAAALEAVLRQEGAWEEGLVEELQQGFKYWQLERRICAAMAACPCLPASTELSGAGSPTQDVQGHQPPLTQQSVGHPPGKAATDAAAAVATTAFSDPTAAGAQGSALDRLQQLEQRFVQERQQQAAGAGPPMQRSVGTQQASGLQEQGRPVPTCADADDTPQQHVPVDSMAQPSSSAGSPAILLCDVLAAHEAKSFDYRVLHRLLHLRLGRPPDATLLEFCRVDELLVDIGDDLTDYEDDVTANSFNVYRGFLHLYGTQQAQLRLVDRIIQLERQREALLGQLTPAQQQQVLARQQSAAVGQGSDKWVFPPPIINEEAFRAEMAAVPATGPGAAAASMELTVQLQLHTRGYTWVYGPADSISTPP